MTPVQPGDVMRARGLATVVESRSPAYKTGDVVIAGVNWAEYCVLPASELRPAPELPAGLSRTHYLGALGITGLTAYFGLTEVAAVRPEDTVVVSGAGGATGMMAVQIAKRIVGCRKVVGIAGGEEKCRWVEGLGADVCLNCELMISFFIHLVIFAVILLLPRQDLRGVKPMLRRFVAPKTRALASRTT